MTDFDLQTKSGQLWPDIVAYGQARDARIAVLEAFLAKAKEAFNAGDFDSAKTILNAEIGKVEQSDTVRKKAELDEQITKLQAERAKLDEAKAEAAQK
jgi:hypothetical protein